MELPAGTKIDRYVLEAPLGSGGFATVYRASHSMIGHAVALKLLLPEHTRSPAIVERLFREARAAASIGNPHIVKVLDCGTSPEGLTFLTMELLRGQVLTDVIGQQGALPVERAVVIGLQMLDGLAAAHAAGIVHRDIKPENVFLTPDPDSGGDFVKLLDFGIAKNLAAGGEALTSDGEVLGTPFYMAPEQVHGAAGVDHRADLYGVAAVLYHMLAGRRPVVAVTLAELIRKLILETPPALGAVAPGVGPELSAVVMRGLARSVDERWPDAVSFAAALRSCLPAPGDSTDVDVALPEARPAFAATLARLPPAAGPANTGPASWPAPTSPPVASPLPTAPSWVSGELPAQLVAPAPRFPSVAPVQQLAAPPASPETTQGLRAALSTRRVPLWVLLALIGVTAVFSAAVVVAIVVGVGIVRDDDRGGGGGVSVPTLFAGGGQTIGQGQAVSGTLQTGRTLDYALHVDRAGPVSISLMGDFDCYLRVLQRGAVLFEDDDGGGGLNSRVSATLVPGDYVVQVGSFQNGDGGSFVLSVQ